MSEHVLTLVQRKEGEIVLHADAKGLALLIAALERLKKKAEEGASDHDHLMTPAWAGTELSEKKGAEAGALIHHLKIYGWSEEAAKEHGFRE
ncbi:MAG: Imm32 family immunity protein [Verrucomicrobiota bacterium]